MGFGRRKDKASRPWRLSAKLLIASSIVTVLGFSAICTSVMLDMRHSEEELARQTLENLASGIDSDIGRNVEIFDLSLRAVATYMLAPEINEVGKPLDPIWVLGNLATQPLREILATEHVKTIRARHGENHGKAPLAASPYWNVLKGDKDCWPEKGCEDRGPEGRTIRTGYR